MTCKDCYHFESCIKRNGWLENYSNQFFEKRKCAMFKTKISLLEIPCDKVYCIVDAGTEFER